MAIDTSNTWDVGDWGWSDWNSGEVKPKLQGKEIGTAEQKALRTNFFNWLNQQGAAEGYQDSTDRDFTAPMSSYESSGLESLQKYLAQADPEHYGDIDSAMKQALSGESPYTVDRDATSDYLRDAVMPGLRRDYGKMRTDLQESFAGGGKYWATPRLEAEENLSEEYLRNAGETVAGYRYKDVEAERAGKSEGAQIAAGTLPYASSISDYLTGGDLRKTEASQQYGSLPRLLEQNDLTAEYQDWLATKERDMQMAQLKTQALGMPTEMSFMSSGKPGWLSDVGQIIGGALSGGK